MARHISFVFLALAAVARAQTPAATPAGKVEFPVDSITIEGNRILTAAGITAASGLKPGMKGSAAVFDAARDRLLASGYFETVGYRFKPSEKGAGYEVSFEVREMQPLYPIRIEALPATTEEITQLLKSKDPLFTGRIPGTQQVLDRTSREIEQYLEPKKYSEKVAGRIVSIAPERYEAQFTPGRGLPNVAEVSFEGNKAIGNTKLHNALASVAFGQPYTETNFRLLLDNQIRPLYEKDGYVRVSFPKIVTTPSPQVKGIDVKITVDEGVQYKLGDVSVRGAMESDSKHILRVAKVPKMAVVDFEQMKQAATRVKESMRHEGYLDVEVSTDRDINDEKKTVDVFFIVQPGSQYTFGKLNVVGLGLDGDAAIRKMWVVKSGDPFPADYPDYFLARVREGGLFDRLGDTKAKPEINPDTHVVDVTLEFRYAPPPPPRRPDQQQPW